MRNKHIGKFRIAVSLIDTMPEKIIKVFNIMECIPVRAEMLYSNSEIEYVAISPLFRKVELGMETPEYIINITIGDKGNIEDVDAILKEV